MVKTITKWAFGMAPYKKETYKQILFSIDVLKIGMTTRDVVVRAREINSATGVLYPLGVRKVFKVHDAHSAEKAIHKALAEYRIRDDREFFKIGFQDACGKIEKLIADFDL